MDKNFEELINEYDGISFIERVNNNKINEDLYLIRIENIDFIFICPNRNDKSSYPTICVEKGKMIDKPHIMFIQANGETIGVIDNKYEPICLYENESVVWSLFSYEEKIRDALDRIFELMNMSSSRIEEEFHKEFSFYWKMYAEKTKYIIFIKESGFLSLERFYNRNEKSYRLIQNNLTLSDINEKDKKNRNIWQKEVSTECFYIPVKDIRGIVPPNMSHEWTIDDVIEIIYAKQIEHIDKDVINNLKNHIVKSRDIILVFGFEFDSIPITFGVRIKCNNTNNRSVFEKVIKDSEGIELLSIERSDYTYLSRMIGNIQQPKINKVLMVGCGSLGSYIVPELVKNGIVNIKIYDGETIEEQNTLRWSYFGFGINHKKPIVSATTVNGIHPEITAEPVNRNISSEELLEESKNFDLIISTIGNSDQQLEFNKVLKKNNCNIPVIYVWLEAGGKYSHILVVNYDKEGCYQCLYTNKNGTLINNRASINTLDFEDVNIIRNGCGGTRAAYGTAILLRTTSALLNVIEMINRGELTENTLFDITPTSFEESKTKLVAESCECCGIRKE